MLVPVCKSQTSLIGVGVASSPCEVSGWLYGVSLLVVLVRLLSFWLIVYFTRRVWQLVDFMFSDVLLVLRFLCVSISVLSRYNGVLAKVS